MIKTSPIPQPISCYFRRTETYAILSLECDCNVSCITIQSSYFDDRKLKRKMKEEIIILLLQHLKIGDPLSINESSLRNTKSDLTDHPFVFNCIPILLQNPSAACLVL